MDCDGVTYSGSMTFPRLLLPRPPFSRLPFARLDISSSALLPRLDTFPSGTLPRPGHFPIGHFSVQDTSPSRTLLRPGHFSVQDTSPSRTLLRPGQFPVLDTSLSGTFPLRFMSLRHFSYNFSSGSLISFNLKRKLLYEVFS